MDHYLFLSSERSCCPYFRMVGPPSGRGQVVCCLHALVYSFLRFVRTFPELSDVARRARATGRDARPDDPLGRSRVSVGIFRVAIPRDVTLSEDVLPTNDDLITSPGYGSQ